MKTSDIIKSLVFRNKDLAEFCGVSVSMIEQIRAGNKKWGRTVRAKVIQFLDKKISQYEKIKEDFLLKEKQKDEI